MISLFQSTQLGTVGKKLKTKKKRGGGLMVGPCKDRIDVQGNRGRGRFEKTLILLFSQSPPFSPEDERAEGGEGESSSVGEEATRPVSPS